MLFRSVRGLNAEDDVIQHAENFNKLKMLVHHADSECVCIIRIVDFNSFSVLGALDSKTAEDVVDVFRTLNNSGTTIIVVTHNKSVADKCDTLYTIKDGLIV